MRAFLAPASDRDYSPADVPTFSVVIPAYEAALFVDRAVVSALSQTVPPIDVIVSDDGSTDDLAGALAPYGDRVRLVQGAHGGPPAARNRGFRAASGDFVANLDADDVLHPEWLEALGELAAARPDLDILTSDSYLVIEGERLRRCYSGGWLFYTDDQRRRILERSFITSITAVRRSRFEELGGFDETIRWCDDWDFWLRLILAGARAGCVDEPLADYTVRPDSISTRRQDVLRAKLRLLEKARAEGGLADGEQQSLSATMAEARLELERLELQRALIAREPDYRRRAAAVALGSGHPALARAKLAMSAIAPSIARRALVRRDERTWIGAGGTRVTRP